MSEQFELPLPHTQSAEAEQAQAEYEAAVVRKRGWADDPIVQAVATLNGCKPEDVTPAQRRAAKLVTFREAYGGGLRPYQQEMIAQLVGNEPFGILEVPRGLGKTLRHDFAELEQRVGAVELGTSIHVSFESFQRQSLRAMRAMQKMRAEALLQGWHEMAGSTPFDVMLCREMSEKLGATSYWNFRDLPAARTNGKPPQYQPTDDRRRTYGDKAARPAHETIVKNRAKAKAARKARKRNR